MERGKIPRTDCRLRPDQRALEEGRLAEAENVKLGLEQAQRDRRRQREHDQVDLHIFYYYLIISIVTLRINSWSPSFLSGSSMKGRQAAARTRGGRWTSGGSQANIGIRETKAFIMSNLNPSGDKVMHVISRVIQQNY